MDDYLNELGKRVAPILRGIGFKGRPWKFVRETNEVALQLFSLHMRSGYFFVELGVNFRFLPEMRGFAVSRLGRDSCEVGHRLGPEGEADHRFSASPAGAAELLALMPCAIRWFEQYAVPDKLFSDAVPADIADRKLARLFPFVTKVRQARILAFFHEHLQHKSKAKDFASYGLSIAGYSAGPKVEFLEMLKRLS